jgi:hypothetical protein
VVKIGYTKIGEIWCRGSFDYEDLSWIPISDHKTEAEAAESVHKLPLVCYARNEL